MKDSPQAPQAPDPYATANAQAAANKDVALYQTGLNRPDVYTPLGSQVYSYQGLDPTGAPHYRQDINLTPQGQRIYDTQLGQSEQMAQLGNTSLAQTQQSLGQPFRFGSAQDVQDQAYGAIQSRLDPMWNAREGSFEQKMAAQGIPVGSEAYGNARREFDTGRNDAYQQAVLGAIQTTPQTLQTEQAIRQQPLNELNALRTGSQVQMPQFSTAQAGMVGQTPIAQALQNSYGAQMNGYNQQVGQNNAMMNGLFTLGGAGLQGAGAAGGFGKLFGF